MAVYMGCALGYAVAAGLLAWRLLRLDWLTVAREARANAGGSANDECDSETSEKEKDKYTPPTLQAETEPARRSDSIGIPPRPAQLRRTQSDSEAELQL